MKFIFVLFFFTSLAALSLYEVHALDCYRCSDDDCKDLTNKIEYCGPSTTTADPTTTDGPTTTDDPTTTEDPSTTSSPTETTSSTDSPTSLTGSSTTSTDTSAGPTGTSSTELTDTSTASSSQTDSTSSTTNPTAQTDTSEPTSSSLSSSTDSTSTESTNSPNETSNTDSTSTTTNLQSAANNEEDVIDEDMRKFNPKSVAPLFRVRRDASPAYNDGTYACYQAFINNTEERGCLFIPSGESGCTALANENNSSTVDQCQVCAMDGCNNGNMIRIQKTSSLIIVLSSVVMACKYFL